ncbi:hypothetical protein [Planctobacterium marinum]|uniref:hypothetical protein n=1 Tax=Planctobacterium marinum TaxID=1631968 RepID=UPI0030C6BF81
MADTSFIVVFIIFPTVVVNCFCCFYCFLSFLLAQIRPLLASKIAGKLVNQTIRRTTQTGDNLPSQKEIIDLEVIEKVCYPALPQTHQHRSYAMAWLVVDGQEMSAPLRLLMLFF